jgi:hypothetical protein
MKLLARLGLGIGALVVLLVGVVLFRTLTYRAPAAVDLAAVKLAPAPVIDQAAAAVHLSQAIRIRPGQKAQAIHRDRWAWGRGLERQLVDRQMIYGDPGLPETEPGSPWKALTDLRRAPISHASGRTVPLLACAIDRTPAGPEFRALREVEHYYPATLHLIALAAANLRYQSCVKG